jgi:hypothetical protein
MEVHTMTPDEKYDRILNGERIVCSDHDLEEMPFHPFLVSIMNPRAVGTKDTYIAFIKNSEADCEYRPEELP